MKQQQIFESTRFFLFGHGKVLLQCRVCLNNYEPSNLHPVILENYHQSLLLYRFLNDIFQGKLPVKKPVCLSPQHTCLISIEPASNIILIGISSLSLLNPHPSYPYSPLPIMKTSPSPINLTQLKLTCENCTMACTTRDLLEHQFRIISFKVKLHSLRY